MVTMPCAVVPDRGPDRSQCWCCGTSDDPARMVWLGDHPEVALCVRCARWAGKSAARIDDRDRSGPLVAGRAVIRGLRRRVMDHGLQHNRFFGRALRWVGKYLP